MKQGLQLRLSQQLAMTPQLQQAIRLLQLSTLELQQELQQALESNPLLEQIDTHEEIDTRETQDSETLDTADALEQKEMPEELPLDASWDTNYTAGTPSGTSGDYIDDELPVYQGETTQTLQDYLMWQVELTPFSDTDRAIATSIVDAVDAVSYTHLDVYKRQAVPSSGSSKPTFNARYCSPSRPEVRMLSELVSGMWL